MSAAKDIKTPFGMVDIKSFSPGVQKIDFSEVDRQLSWNTLFNDFGSATKSKESPLNILPNILVRVRNYRLFGENECYLWYCNKLITQLNKTIGNCIVSSVNANLKAEEKKQLLAVLSQNYTEQLNDRINSLVRAIAQSIAGYFKGNLVADANDGVSRENVLSLIKVIDDPKLLNTNDMYNLDQSDISPVIQAIRDISTLPRSYQLLISQLIPTIPVGQDVTDFMRSYISPEYITELLELKLQPLTWDSITLYQESINAIHTNLNILEPRLGDTVIAGIEACVIDNFLKKLPDEEVIIVVKEFKSLIDGTKSDSQSLGLYKYNYRL